MVEVDLLETYLYHGVIENVILLLEAEHAIVLGETFH